MINEHVPWSWRQWPSIYSLVLCADGSTHGCAYSLRMCRMRTRLVCLGWKPLLGPVRIRHSIREIVTEPVILLIELGRRPKWLPLQYGYNDVMCMAPIRAPFPGLESCCTCNYSFRILTRWFPCSSVRFPSSPSASVITPLASLIIKSQCLCGDLSKFTRQKELQTCVLNQDVIGETGMVDHFDVSLSSSFIRKKRPYLIKASCVPVEFSRVESITYFGVSQGTRRIEGAVRACRPPPPPPPPSPWP